uniref:Uncharacterized protein n=1 Tax=Stylophora pistillata TaxID=50429 RepID=A0A2B4R1W4_STYPI
MTLSLRHFLWATLFGFLFSFQIFASDSSVIDDDGDDIVPTNSPQEIYGNVEDNTMPWLPIHDTLLNDLDIEYRRAKGCGRFFDISSDVLKTLGYVGLAGSTTLAYLETAFGGGYFALASGITGSVSGALLFVAEKADGGVKSKLAEMKEILSRIVTLQWRRHNLGEDNPVDEDDSDEASVYKHIPVYYPDHVGSVGGIVGLVGGLGGFFLPITFGIMNDLIGVWTSCFMLLTILISIALTWMHFAIQRMERQQYPELRGPKYLPELAADGESVMAFLKGEAFKQRSELLAQESEQLKQRAEMLEKRSKEMMKKSNQLKSA